MTFTELDHQLYARFVFPDFSAAFAFMTQVAMLAEHLGHHPEWRNVYATVDIWLTTHDAGNTITDLDRRMATAIEAIYSRYR